MQKSQNKVFICFVIVATLIVTMAIVFRTPNPMALATNIIADPNTITHSSKALNQIYNIVSECVAETVYPVTVTIKFVDTIIDAVNRKGKAVKATGLFTAQPTYTGITFTILIYSPQSKRSNEQVLETTFHELVHLVMFLDDTPYEGDDPHQSPIFKKCTYASLVG